MKKTPNPKSAKKPATAVAPRVVGRVTPKERDEIRALYERRNGLKELVLSLQQNNAALVNEAFYEKLVADMGKTMTRFQKWWDNKAKAYGWTSEPGGHWSIDFDTCEISLSKQ